MFHCVIVSVRYFLRDSFDLTLFSVLNFLNCPGNSFYPCLISVFNYLLLVGHILYSALSFDNLSSGNRSTHIRNHSRSNTRSSSNTRACSNNSRIYHTARAQVGWSYKMTWSKVRWPHIMGLTDYSWTQTDLLSGHISRYSRLDESASGWTHRTIKNSRHVKFIKGTNLNKTY